MLQISIMHVHWSWPILESKWQINQIIDWSKISIIIRYNTLLIINYIQWWNFPTKVKANQLKEKLSKLNTKSKGRSNNIKKRWGEKLRSLGKKVSNLKVILLSNDLGNEKNNMLPNSYPFKMQILEKYKSEKPIPESSPN